MSTVTCCRGSLGAALAAGQDIWLDGLSRGLLETGELSALVTRAGVSGVTTNPAIFEKAISGSRRYDVHLQALLRNGHRPRSAEECYEALAIEDVQRAADTLAPIYQLSHGRAGFVSLQLRPAYADNVSMSVAEAQHLCAAVRRPNLMIAVPATRAGIVIIQELLASGINVNATLIFSVDIWQAVWRAFCQGLSERLADGSSIERVASVASFFVGSIDTEADTQLAVTEHAQFHRARGNRLARCRGQTALAVAALVYHAYQKALNSSDWRMLERRGAQPQRLLWASMACRLEGQPSTLYAEGLARPDTISTLELGALRALADHRGSTLEVLDPALAAEALAELNALGIPMAPMADRLLAEGVSDLAQAFERLIASLEARRRALLADNPNTVSC